MMHVTLDAQHTTPIRQALFRDCSGQPWTIRLAPLPGTDRMRLSPCLPRDAVSGAILQVVHLAPTAQPGKLFEVQNISTDAWRDLLNPVSLPCADPVTVADEMAAWNDSIAKLLSQDHVLLGLCVHNRQSPFVHRGQFCEQHTGLPGAPNPTGFGWRNTNVTNLAIIYQDNDRLPLRARRRALLHRLNAIADGVARSSTLWTG